jgi:hypothetical protein
MTAARQTSAQNSPPPPAQYVKRQGTHVDFSPYWAKEAELVTVPFNTKKISAEESSPEDECLSKKTPAQITKSSKGQHNKGQSAASGKGTKHAKNKKNRKANK